MGNKTNNISIGSMENSQIQQDVQNSTQKNSQDSYHTDLNDFLTSFMKDISKIQDQAVAQALRADAEIIRAQNNAQNPKKEIIKECLLSIKNIIEGTAGSVLSSYIPLILPLINCI